MIRHHLTYSMTLFAYEILDSRKGTLKCANTEPILEKVICLFAVKELLADPVALYETGFFTPKQGHHAKLSNVFTQLLTEIRPHVIPLVEVTPFDMAFENSTIGNSKGDIYEH